MKKKKKKEEERKEEKENFVKTEENSRIDQNDTFSLFEMRWRVLPAERTLT
jgi:hypothetical protein